MEPSEYKMMFEVEDRHWWYVGMQRLTLRLLHQVYGEVANLAILDAGCGTGAGFASTTCTGVAVSATGGGAA